MVAGEIQGISITYTPGMLVPLSMCSKIFRFADLDIDSHIKKNHQGNSNRNRSPLDIYQVYHDIQNTDGFWWWNAQPYFSHENLNSFIICILPRWNIVIHTVSPELEIIDLTDDLCIQSLG